MPKTEKNMALQPCFFRFLNKHQNTDLSCFLLSPIYESLEYVKHLFRQIYR